MNANKINIESLIPHRKPFIMVDKLISATDTLFESTFVVKKDNLFIKNNLLLEPAIIENIAQTCAAGLNYSQKESEASKIGFIGSISKLKSFKLPPLNAQIRTTAEITNTISNVFMIKGSSYLKNDLLLECEIKIVIIDN